MGIGMILVLGTMQILYRSNLSKTFSNQALDFEALKESIAALAMDPAQCSFKFDPTASLPPSSSLVTLLQPGTSTFPPNWLAATDPYYSPIPLKFTTSAGTFSSAGTLIGGAYYQLWLEIPTTNNPSYGATHYDYCLPSAAPGPVNSIPYSLPLWCQGDLFLVRVRPNGAMSGTTGPTFPNQLGAPFVIQKVSGIIFQVTGSNITCQPGNLTHPTPLSTQPAPPAVTTQISPSGMNQSFGSIPSQYLMGLSGSPINSLPLHPTIGPDDFSPPPASTPYNFQFLTTLPVVDYQ
jgi:hypothetical protein